MEEVRRIRSQLRRAFEGTAWHGPSLKELLAEVTAEKAARKPLAGGHSIWELVLHIATWESVVRRRLEGETVEPTSEEDWPQVADTTEPSWKDALAALEDGNLRLREAVARLTDAQLNETAAGCNYTVYFMLHGVIQHDLYHAGQIALLKKV